MTDGEVVFWHESTRSFLVIYVDDFKMVSTVENTARLWKELGEVIELGPYTTPNRFLGCKHHQFTAPASDFESILRHNPKLRPRGSTEAAPLAELPRYEPTREVRGFVYDMQNYFEKNVQTYLEVTNTPARRLGRADTPSLDESRFQMGCQADPTAPAEQGGAHRREAGGL